MTLYNVISKKKCRQNTSNPDYRCLNIHAEVGNKPIYIQSSNVNNNEPTEEKLKKSKKNI